MTATYTHDSNALGPLRLGRTEAERLHSLVGLVVELATKDDMPLSVVVAGVLGAIEERNLPLCCTQPGQMACVVGAETRVPVFERPVYFIDPNKPWVDPMGYANGRSELLTWLRETWGSVSTTDELLSLGGARIAILKADAISVFGAGEPRSFWEGAPERPTPEQLANFDTITSTPRTAASSPVAAAGEPSTPVHGDAMVSAEPAHTEGETLAEKRRRAVARLRELGDIKGARPKVAGEFSCDVRTIGKWLAAVEKEEAAARQSGGFAASLVQLRAA